MRSYSGVSNFCDQTGSGSHPAWYPMGTTGALPRCKTAGQESCTYTLFPLTFFKFFIGNQNYIWFYKLICYDSVRREDAYPKISPHYPFLRSAGTVSAETNSVPFPSPLTTRRDYGGSILTRLHTGIPVIWLNFFPCNPILFAICTSTFSKLCKQRMKHNVEGRSVELLCK
jgi:hypothetical protein